MMHISHPPFPPAPAPKSFTELLQAAQIAALDAIKSSFAHGTRMHIVGQVIILTLSGPNLKPGVPDGPSNQDIDAAIAHLRAMKTTLNATRAKAAQPV